MVAFGNFALLTLLIIVKGMTTGYLLSAVWNHQKGEWGGPFSFLMTVIFGLLNYLQTLPFAIFDKSLNPLGIAYFVMVAFGTALYCGYPKNRRYEAGWTNIFIGMGVTQFVVTTASIFCLYDLGFLISFPYTLASMACFGVGAYTFYLGEKWWHTNGIWRPTASTIMVSITGFPFLLFVILIGFKFALGLY